MHTASRNSNNSSIKTYYKNYCKLLSKFIKAARYFHFLDICIISHTVIVGKTSVLIH